jgi:hypothetical protein
MRGRKGVSPAALVTLAATLVLLTAVTSYIAYANTLKIHDSLRNNLKVEVEMRRELKISLTSGLPPSVSPKAYVVIHEMSGYQEVLYDLVYADNRSNIRHVRLNIDMNEGDCVVLTPFYLASNGLPDRYTRYNGSNLVIHSSKAVGNAVPRELKPDEIYPCTRRGSGSSQYSIFLRVALDGSICTTTQCNNLLTPPARSTAYVRNTYTVFNITAAGTARINNVNYTFIGWLVHVYPMQTNPATAYTMNPLPLWVDGAYDVVALYASRRSDGSWNWDWHRNCFRNEYGEIDCRF